MDTKGAWQTYLSPQKACNLLVAGHFDQGLCYGTHSLDKQHLRSLHTAAFFGPNFGANSVKKICLTLSQSRLHTARRNFVRIIIFRIRVNLFRFSQSCHWVPCSLSLPLSLLSVSPWPADFGFPKRNEITHGSLQRPLHSLFYVRTF